MIAGVGFKLGSAAGPLLAFYDGTQRGVCLGYVPTSGELEVYCDSTLLGTTTGAGLQSGVWAYVGSEGPLRLFRGFGCRAGQRQRRAEPGRGHYQGWSR